MSTTPDVEVGDDGRVQIEPTETGSLNQIWIAGQPVGNILISLDQRVDTLESGNRELEEETDQLRERVEELEAMVGSTQQSVKPAKGTKKDLAIQIAHDEAVRVSTQGISGGAIEYGTVRDIAHRQHDRELNPSTIYGAFRELAATHEYLRVQDGERGPNTPNKKLICERGAVPNAVLRSVTGGQE